jgi:hypothetical protein
MDFSYFIEFSARLYSSKSFLFFAGLSSSEDRKKVVNSVRSSYSLKSALPKNKTVLEIFRASVCIKKLLWSDSNSSQTAVNILELLALDFIMK